MRGMWPFSRRLPLLLASCIAFAPTASGQAAPEPPLRLASLNLCTDQLLLLLAPRERIVSLSHLAVDPRHSPLAAAARGLHLNHALAEELLPLQPDLVLGGQFSASLASNLLQRFGLPVLRLGVANSLDDIRAQITELASAIGEETRGETLLRELDTELARQRQTLLPRTRGRSALFYSSNGVAAGSGTLQDDFLRSLGMHNAAGELQGQAPMDLEAVLRAAPDFLFTSPPQREDALLAHAPLRHPALRALPERLRVIALPEHAFACAGPHYADAYVALAGQL